MICQNFPIISDLGYSQTLFSWVVFNYHMGKIGTTHENAHPIVVYHRGPLKYIQHEKKTDYVVRGRGNLFVCSNDAHFQYKNVIVNKTQKPVDLYRDFIFRFCEIGGIVLDICSGSGTGAIAASTFGYSSVSVDIRANQIEATKSRLNNTSIVVKIPQAASSYIISNKVEKMEPQDKKVTDGEEKEKNHEEATDEAPARKRVRKSAAAAEKIPSAKDPKNRRNSEEVMSRKKEQSSSQPVTSKVNAKNKNKKSGKNNRVENLENLEMYSVGEGLTDDEYCPICSPKKVAGNLEYMCSETDRVFCTEDHFRKHYPCQLCEEDGPFVIDKVEVSNYEPAEEDLKRNASRKSEAENQKPDKEKKVVNEDEGSQSTDNSTEEKEENTIQLPYDAAKDATNLKNTGSPLLDEN